MLEVKNSVVNKGRAASSLILNMAYDFILAAGDDLTDEFMFEALPEPAYTVKIGLPDTKAHFYLTDRRELQTLLREFLLDKVR